MSSNTPSPSSEYSSLFLEIKDIHLEPEQRSDFDLIRFYVTLSIGGKEQRTTEEKSTQWPSSLEIVAASPSTPLHIGVTKVKKLWITESLGHYYGIVEDLIKNSGSPVSFLLDKGGKKHLSMSVIQKCNTTKDTDSSPNAGEDAKKAIDLAGNLPSGSSSTQIQSVVGTAESVQQIAAKAFDAAKSLPEASVVGEALKNIGTFVDMVDRFAEIHPYVNEAWKVLSAVYKVWQTHAQQVQSIRDLAESLRNMLDFVELGKDIQELEKGIKVIADMWKAIKDAAGIIEELCKDSSSVVEAMRKKVEEDIEDTQERFSQLRADLDSVVGFQALKEIKRVINVVKAFHMKELSKVERELIDRLPSARVLKAGYERVAPALEGTRTKLLEMLCKELTDTNPGTPRVIWVHGLAGTGKSTISATIARRLEEQNVLAGNFFFSRSDKDRSDPEMVFPALARQFASFPPLRGGVVKALKDNNTDIAKAQLSTQFSELIATPLHNLHTHSSPVVLVIDALDECISPERILKIIETNNSRLPSCLKIFLTSRPETLITSIMQRMGRAVREYPLMQSYQDVRLAFEDRLSDIRSEYKLQDDWPGKEQLDKLVEKANGLFIWMSAVCKFIKGLNPLGRLELVLGINTEENENPFAGLDDLYLQVLREAFPEGHSKRRQRHQLLFPNILGTIVVAKIALSEMELVQLLGIQMDEFRSTISGLRALLHIPRDRTEPIQILHPSFIDFATHRERCEDDRLFIDSDDHHRRLALRCLQIMNNELKENICGIDSTLFNSEIENLSSLISRCISGALQYACRFWAGHLDHASPDQEIETSLITFYKNHILHWLEVLSLLGRFDSAHGSLITGQTWLRKYLNRKLDETFRTLVDDCRKFVKDFKEPISQSALHVYRSALPFTGKKTQLYKTYSNSCESNILVSSAGTEESSSNPSVLGGHANSMYAAMFSPDTTRIVSWSWDATLQLRDGFTGAPIGGRIMNVYPNYFNPVVFSPDGMRMVSWSWDATLRLFCGATGVLIEDSMSGHTDYINSVIFSPNATRIVSCSKDKTLRLWDGLTGDPIGEAMIGHADVVYSAMFSPDGTRIVSCSKDKTLRSWDGVTGAPIGKAMNGHIAHVNSVIFSPDGTRIVSCSDDATLRLWDSATSAPIGGVMNGHTDVVNSATFSPDGARIVSHSKDKTLRLWDGVTGAPIGSTMKGHTSCINSVVFSPDGTQIMSTSYNEVLLWDTRQQRQITSPHDMWYLKTASLGFSFNIKDGWVYGVSPVGGKKKLWWMPGTYQCSTPDGRFFTGNVNGPVTIVDGRKALRLSL